ncbi:hypothetical protein KJ966_17285 [bacterium]|nr:hypothetical protein [bacterium]
MSVYSNQYALKLGEHGDNGGLEANFKTPVRDPLLHTEYVSSVNQERFSTIGKLESGVSLLQTAQQQVEKIRSWLREIHQFLDGQGGKTSPLNIPKSVINKYLEDRLNLVKEAVDTASFQNRTILNGDCGVMAKATGQNLRFVRGSARVISSQNVGYPVAVFQAPKSSMLVGTNQVTAEDIQKETLIAISDGMQEARYYPRKDETPESLIVNLRRSLVNHNVEVDVFRTKDNRLFFKHNQLGSKYSFKVLSSNSCLVSSKPGQYRPSIPGIDIAGTIGAESAHGDGGFLIGDVGNKQTDGLIVYYDGTVDFPGQVVGHIETIQQGLTIPLDTAESKFEILSIPSIHPEVLAIGVTYRSGFKDLNSIRVSNEYEWRDALKMVLWSLVYLEYLSKELKAKEDDYVDRTISLLQGNTGSIPANNETLCFSQEKVNDMVSQLKEMLK